MSKYQDKLIHAAEQAIAENARLCALDPDDLADAGTGLYHLLNSLITYSDDRKIDFDAILSDLRQDLKQDAPVEAPKL